MEARAQGGKEGEEEGDGKEVAVEKVFVPVGAIFRVRQLGVETHDGGEDLREGQDGKAGEEGWICAAGRGAGGGGSGGGFALQSGKVNTHPCLTSKGQEF